MRPTLLAALTLALSLAAPIAAQTPDEAEQLVHATITKVRAALVLDDPESGKPGSGSPSLATRQRVIELLHEVFDFELMAKLTLGRQVWKTATDRQQELFTDLFIEQLGRSYLSKMSLILDLEISVMPAVSTGNKVSVMTELKGGERTHTILYKLYRRENEWRGYDVEINGISTIRSFRSQYEPSLRDGGMERLLDEMRKRQ